MNRRSFIQKTGGGVAALAAMPLVAYTRQDTNLVRLGGRLFEPYEDPEQWVLQLKSLGYKAAYCPVKPGADASTVLAYEKAAKKNDIVIAEVGAWSNPISPDSQQAKEAMEKCVAGLQLADQIGAKCCVNISGSRNLEYWAGPHADNLTDEVFDLVVENTRKIIDAVRPTRTHFALEAMPWSFPDSTESYLRLLRAMDRDRFAVHIDPVNMIRSPREYYGNGQLIKEMFSKLGPHIVSAHAKDIILREDNLIPQLDELQAGLGNLDYAVYLRELSKLKDVPLMIEHLKSAEEYARAAQHIRSVAQSEQIPM